MQTKVTLFGQHFHLSLVSGDKNPTMILSNTDETHRQVVPIDKYELKGVADFIYKYLENNTRDQQPRTQEVATINDENERSGASDGSMQPLAWGVMPGDNLPLWRCSSRQQAEKVVVWLREQRPASTPQAVPLVDGRRPPTLTDAEREAVDKMRVHLYEISRDNAFIEEVCDDAKASCEAIAAFLERHK